MTADWHELAHELADALERGDAALLDSAEQLDLLLAWLAGSQDPSARALAARVGPGDDPQNPLRGRALELLDHSLFDPTGAFRPSLPDFADVGHEQLLRRFRQLNSVFHPDRHAANPAWATPRSQSLHRVYRAFRQGEGLSSLPVDGALARRPPATVEPAARDLHYRGEYAPSVVRDWLQRLRWALRDSTHSVDRVVGVAVLVAALLGALVWYLQPRQDRDETPWHTQSQQAGMAPDTASDAGRSLQTAAELEAMAALARQQAERQARAAEALARAAAELRAESALADAGPSLAEQRADPGRSMPGDAEHDSSPALPSALDAPGQSMEQAIGSTPSALAAAGVGEDGARVTSPNRDRPGFAREDTQRRAETPPGRSAQAVAIAEPTSAPPRPATESPEPGLQGQTSIGLPAPSLAEAPAAGTNVMSAPGRAADTIDTVAGESQVPEVSTARVAVASVGAEPASASSSPGRVTPPPTVDADRSAAARSAPTELTLPSSDVPVPALRSAHPLAARVDSLSPVEVLELYRWSVESGDLDTLVGLTTGPLSARPVETVLGGRIDPDAAFAANVHRVLELKPVSALRQDEVLRLSTRFSLQLDFGDRALRRDGTLVFELLPSDASWLIRNIED